MIALKQSPDAPAASQFDRCLRDQDMGERDTPALHPPPEPGVPHSRVAILARPTAPGGAHAERNLQRHFWPFVRNPPPGFGVGWSRAAVSGSETGGKQPSVLRLIAPPIPTPAMGRSPKPECADIDSCETPRRPSRLVRPATKISHLQWQKRPKDVP